MRLWYLSNMQSFLNFASWEIFPAFLSSADFFFQNQLFRKILSGIPRVSNRLDPDQTRRFVGPDLGPNCLQKYQQRTLGGRVKYGMMQVQLRSELDI